MAVVTLIPVQGNPQLFENCAISYELPVVNDPTGAPINFTSWASFQASARPAVPGPLQGTEIIGSVTGNSTGGLILYLSGQEFGAGGSGSCRFTITGVHVSGDPPQLLAWGVINYIATTG